MSHIHMSRRSSFTALHFKNFNICPSLFLCPQQSGLKCGDPWKLRVGLFQMLPIMFAFGGQDVRDDLVRLLGHACAVMLPMRVVIIQVHNICLLLLGAVRPAGEGARLHNSRAASDMVRKEKREGKQNLITWLFACYPSRVHREMEHYRLQLPMHIFL